MVLTSISHLNIKSINIPFPSSSSSSSVTPTNPPSLFCKLHTSSQTKHNDERKWKTVLSTALAAAVITFSSDKSAMADLNKYQAETQGEFRIGSASQYDSANLRRANVTSTADMRGSDFNGSKLNNGDYLDKAVAYKANFTEGRDDHEFKDTTNSPFYTSFIDTDINQQQTPKLEDFNNKNQEELKAMAAMVDFVKWVMEDSLQEFANFVMEYFTSRGHYSLSRLYEHTFKDEI